MLELRINDQLIAPADIEADTTLLDYLRNRMRLTGTKEGCASGDCGACTVIVGRLSGTKFGWTAATTDPGTTEGQEAGAPLIYCTVDSCITPLAALHGTQVLTVDAVGKPEALHPVQAAMVAHHASQCGFCTPGFVMSLVGACLPPPPTQQPLESGLPNSDLAERIAGNLCRCTGYRSILAAADQALKAPPSPIPALAGAREQLQSIHARPAPERPLNGYHMPRDEAALQSMLRDGPQDARLVCGATDLWLEVTQQYRTLANVIDVSAVAELKHIAITETEIIFGAAVTHAELLPLFQTDGPLDCPAIATMLKRFASPQIRNRGSIGGNLANGSPIADWPPVLLVLDADVTIGHADTTVTRVPLTDFWRGYRKTALNTGDYLRDIHFAPPAWETVQVYKISKRHEDDISTVLGAFRFELHAGLIRTARIAYGGIAATPIRLEPVEQLLVGHAPADYLEDRELQAAIEAAMRLLINPITDVRASASYRSALVRALLQRAVLAIAPSMARESAPLDLAAVEAS